MVQTYIRHQQSTLDYPLLYPIVDAPRTKWSMTVDGEHRIHYYRVYRPDVTGKVVSSLIEGEWNWAIYQDDVFENPPGHFDRLADGVAFDAYTAMAQVDEAYANLVQLEVL